MTAVTAKRTSKSALTATADLPGDELVYRGSDFAIYSLDLIYPVRRQFALPLGVASNDMPVGVQFVAPHGQDKLLLELSLELETRQPLAFYL